MNRAIIAEYLKTSVFAVFTSVAISLVLCFFLFFHNQEADGNLPQHLVRSIGQYLTIQEQEIRVDPEGLERLGQYQLWMQIIDGDGSVVYGVNVPDEIPQFYSNFDLLDAVMYSNRLGAYTVFACPLPDKEPYGVLLGCDSQLVTKVTYHFRGNGNDQVLKCLFVFLIVTAVVVLISSYRFSKKITMPISQALENIEELQAGHALAPMHFSNQALFSDVFRSIKKLEAELKETERMRAEWITNISHDMKTPLATIKGYAELLATDDYEFDRNEIQQYAEQILKSETFMQELVEDLKISQMLAEGNIKLNLESVNLAEMARTCMEQVRQYLHREPNITFHCEKEIFVPADKKLLERCLLNIICNAFVHNDKDVRVEISITEEQGKIQVAITDDGKGMCQADLEHIFERYYRGTDSGKVKGTGLGLAIAKEVILAHGWNIEASSKEGEGTRIVVKIRV